MKELNESIREFYDTSSKLWEETWGEHMHHGYYGPDGREEKDHRQAQVDLIEELLQWGGVTRANRVLDLGCGIGGSSLYLARKFNAHVTGLTLSPVQAKRAIERAREAGLTPCTDFRVADALEAPFQPGAFDLVWSLESGEHIPQKQRFLQRCAEILAPGGKFLMATWCHRPEPPAITDKESDLLRRLYRAYHLPGMISIVDYESLAARAGFSKIQTADWSEAVAPFWKAVVRSLFQIRSLTGLVYAGWSTIHGALAMNLMIRGYRIGLIRFGLLQGTRA